MKPRSSAECPGAFELRGEAEGAVRRARDQDRARGGHRHRISRAERTGTRRRPMPSPSARAASSSAISTIHTSASHCRLLPPAARSAAASGPRSPTFPSANRAPTENSRGASIRLRARSAAPAAQTPSRWLIPCHRVVGSQGSLGGFMGVTEGDPIAIKRWLLTHEGYRFGR